MISKLFKKPTIEDFITELEKSSLNESKLNSMLQTVNINHINQDYETFLHLIIPKNKIESVKFLIKNGIDVNVKDNFGLTALMLACKHGFSDIVNELLKTDVNLDIKTNNDNTAIEFAVYNKYFKIYQQLKPKIKDLNIKNKKNQTLIHTAIKVQNHEVINDLILDKNFVIPEDIIFYKDTFKNKALARKILKETKVKEKFDKNGRNILFYIVENGIDTKEIFLELVEYGIDINTIDKKGNNILVHLIEKIQDLENKALNDFENKSIYKEEIEKLSSLIPIILEKEIDETICNNDNETILSLVIKNKNLELLNILLENEVSIDTTNKDKETGLSLAVMKGSEYIELTYLLLDYGANPNIRDKDSKTIIEKLINACLIVRNQKKVKTSEKDGIDFNTDYVSILTSLLINTDANLNQLNSKEEPYFFEALRNGATDIVKLLIKHGADVNLVDINGKNIIYKYMEENKDFKKESQQKEYYNNLNAIIIMGANINFKDEHGGITLHKAILNCDSTIIKMLLHSGADINAIDNRGRHILHNSIWKNNIKVFKLVYTYNKPLLNEPDKFGVMPINYAAFLGYTDLVLEFIELKAHINNPFKKTKYILNFLKKFHKNLKTLVDNARTKTQKDKLNMLVENMKKEFGVEI